MDQKYPKSTRRPKSHVCKNCKHITVRIKLPRYMEDITFKAAADFMRATARALHITHDHSFWCSFNPEWKYVGRETTHHCGQFELRENWKAGYQDIERTWMEVDKVYETRWDCMAVLERVQRAA